MEKNLKPGMMCLASAIEPINTSASAEVAGKIAKLQNTSEYLQGEFFTDHPRILSATTTEQGGEVSLMIPTSPYAEGGVMVIARGADSFSSEKVNTETVQQYDRNTQYEYWRQIYGALKGFHTITPEENKDRYNIFATENCMVTVTSPEVRTSRSIALPHTHIMRIDETHIEPCDRSIPHLLDEQRILRRKGLIEGFANTVKQEVLAERDIILTDISAKEDAPYGYSFVPSQTSDLDEITDAMHAHHEAYTKLAFEREERLNPANRQRIIPQPSYRQYFYFKDGKFTVTVSPEFLSHAGAIEAAGVFLERQVGYKPRLTEEELQEGYAAILAEIENTKPLKTTNPFPLEMDVFSLS